MAFKTVIVTATWMVVLSDINHLLIEPATVAGSPLTRNVLDADIYAVEWRERVSDLAD